jgi:uncharacterized protein (UPF0335 family)
MQQNTAKVLKDTIDRILRIEEEKAELAADIRDIYAEAKARGFDVKVLRKVVSRKKKKPEEVQKEDEIVELYEGAIQ